MANMMRRSTSLRSSHTPLRSSSTFDKKSAAKGMPVPDDFLAQFTRVKTESASPRAASMADDAEELEEVAPAPATFFSPDLPQGQVVLIRGASSRDESVSEHGDDVQNVFSPDLGPNEVIVVRGSSIQKANGQDDDDDDDEDPALSARKSQSAWLAQMEEAVYSGDEM